MSMCETHTHNYVTYNAHTYIVYKCIYIYMSLWQKVLPLNPGMFVYSYLFLSY